MALPDIDRDGIADQKKTILSNLMRPHGLTFHNGKLYVAEERQVSRYTYDTATNTAIFEKKLFDLPSGGRHFTRGIVFDDNNNLYISLGSTCDTCVEKHPYISTVLVSDSEGEGLRVFSKGLRNAVFLAKDPETGKVFATEMGRDFLGDNLPPDEIVVLQDGGDYGWPYCYGSKIWDRVFGRKDQSYCEGTIAPFYNIPAHSAPLGLTFIESSQMPQDWQNDLLVSYHGSWNRSYPTGYKIVRITNGQNPSEEDFITGFEDNTARPADVVFDKEGSLYISDDEAGAIYKVISSAN